MVELRADAAVLRGGLGRAAEAVRRFAVAKGQPKDEQPAAPQAYRFALRGQWNDFVGEVGRVVTADELQSLIDEGKLTEDVVRVFVGQKALVELMAGG